METCTKILTLPEGKFKTEVIFFTENDRVELLSIYKNWQDLSINAKKLGGRSSNLPEILSEGVFCLEMETARIVKNITGANSSFDAYDFRDNQRIQIKAASVLPDLTSFGPKSEWDKLYFIDFSRLDKTFDIYFIPSNYIYDYPVNSKQTMKEQQKEGKRPRFSIYTGIIKAYNIQPIKTGYLN